MQLMYIVKYYCHCVYFCLLIVICFNKNTYNTTQIRSNEKSNKEKHVFR